MRNPNRIDDFCNKLAKFWHEVPDWRFGQLIINVFNTIPVDPFFPEEDKMIEYFEKFFEKTVDNTKVMWYNTSC